MLSAVDKPGKEAETMGSTFEEYLKALEGAGPRLKELILHRAEQEGEITFEEFLELCKRAYPEDE